MEGFRSTQVANFVAFVLGARSRVPLCRIRGMMRKLTAHGRPDLRSVAKPRALDANTVAQNAGLNRFATSVGRSIQFLMRQPQYRLADAADAKGNPGAIRLLVDRRVVEMSLDEYRVPGTEAVCRD